MTTLLLIAAALSLGLQEPPGVTPADSTRWRIELANGQVQHALSVHTDGELVQLGFREGTLAVPAREVESITADDVRPIPLAEPVRHTVELEQQRLVLTLPAGFVRDTDSTSTVGTFLLPGREGVTVRVARGGRSAGLWQEPRMVREHHAETYPGYHTLGEHFTQLGTRAAWLLSFGYLVGNQPRLECQALVAMGESLIVISVATPPAHHPSAFALAHSIARSLDSR